MIALPSVLDAGWLRLLEVPSSAVSCMIPQENPLVPGELEGVVCISVSDVHEKQMAGKGALHLGGE